MLGERARPLQRWAIAWFVSIATAPATSADAEASFQRASP